MPETLPHKAQKREGVLMPDYNGRRHEQLTANLPQRRMHVWLPKPVTANFDAVVQRPALIRRVIARDVLDDMRVKWSHVRSIATKVNGPLHNAPGLMVFDGPSDPRVSRFMVGLPHLLHPVILRYTVGRC